MNTTANARTSNRIAAGVTATYLRNLSRHATPPAASAVGGRRPGSGELRAQPSRRRGSSGGRDAGAAVRVTIR